MRTESLIAGAWLFSGYGAAASLNSSQIPTGFAPCDALIKSGLGDRVLLATEPAYSARIESYWALNSRQHPYCIVQPRTAQEVSKAMVALLEVNDGAGDWHIAIRAGGHNTGGANNIDNGVTIDLVHLNQVTYDKDTNIASIGPGLKWMDVYAQLARHDVLVTGGRDGDVGVGGFLLGGGSTFFMGTRGFGCDDVKNYEVALTNGTIVNANKNENSDLWRALKGGGSNFCIVTRYDMEALPNKKLAHTVRTLNFTYSTQMASGFVDFTEHYQHHPHDALVLWLMHNTSTLQSTYMGTIQVNTEGNTNSSGFKKLDQIPALAPSPYEHVSLAEAAANSQVQGDAWMAGATITFANDERLIKKAFDMHEDYVQELNKAIGADNFVTMFFFQPMPTMFGDIANKKGGNMIGFDMEERNAILWTAGVEVKTNQEDRIFAQTKMNQMAAKLKRSSQAMGASTDLVYMNYADSSQDPLGSYGAKNVEYMKSVAARYDPEGLFQTRFPLGFKISRVNI
ncbi:hypothetical protein BDV59DRAFT_208908 [Aspergillus ambiguus]|uniref:FAD-binding oxidoreductase n=1 Tax=Aspergillus ambiguus TaxID=176160 RepID=UPI003CCE35E5